jgi:hypothetical protein
MSNLIPPTQQTFSISSSLPHRFLKIITNWFLKSKFIVCERIILVKNNSFHFRITPIIIKINLCTANVKKSMKKIPKNLLFLSFDVLMATGTLCKIQRVVQH